MAKYQVLFEGWVTSSDDAGADVPISSDEIEALLDRMMETLMDSDVDDATYSGALARGAVEISVTVKAEDPLEALVFGNAAIRSAAHGAGAATPGWHLDWCSITLIRSDGPTEVALAV